MLCFTRRDGLALVHNSWTGVINVMLQGDGSAICHVRGQEETSGSAENTGPQARVMRDWARKENMTPAPCRVISVCPSPVINPSLFIWCNVRKRVILCLITVVGQVLWGETTARCAVLHTVHLHRAQYRACTHRESRSQRSEITVITSPQLPL